MVAANESLTIRAGIVNLCNTCIGIGILAKPFALAVSGWIGIVAFMMAAILIIYVGICLSRVSRELLLNNKSIMDSKPIINDSKLDKNYNTINNNENEIIINTKTAITSSKAEKSAYQLLSYKSMGQNGEKLAVVGFIVVVFNILATCIIMIFELIMDIKNDINPDFYVSTILLFLSSFIIYIPTALILNWKQMTFVSWIGVISVITIFISLIGIMLYSFYEFDYKPPPKELLISNINDINSKNLAINATKNMSMVEQLTMSFLLFITGVTGNAAIPKISTSLNNTRDIIIVVTMSYIGVSIFYCICACIAYWIYGEYTNVMILNSFFVWPGGYIVMIVVVLVIINLWASFAIMLSLLGDMIEGLLNVESDGYKRLFRLIALFIVFVYALLLKNHLAFLVAILGVIGVLFSLALTMPIFIYLCTFWNHHDETKRLSIFSKIFHLILLTLCILIGVYVAYNDIVNVL
eukprot:164544_1